jgi:hypothetical protein
VSPCCAKPNFFFESCNEKQYFVHVTSHTVTKFASFKLRQLPKLHTSNPNPCRVIFRGTSFSVNMFDSRTVLYYKRCVDVFTIFNAATITPDEILNNLCESGMPSMYLHMQHPASEFQVATIMSLT